MKHLKENWYLYLILFVIAALISSVVFFFHREDVKLKENTVEFTAVVTQKSKTVGTTDNFLFSNMNSTTYFLHFEDEKYEVSSRLYDEVTTGEQYEFVREYEEIKQINIIE